MDTDEKSQHPNATYSNWKLSGQFLNILRYKILIV